MRDHIVLMRDGAVARPGTYRQRVSLDEAAEICRQLRWLGCWAIPVRLEPDSDIPVKAVRMSQPPAPRVPCTAPHYTPCNCEECLLTMEAD